MGRYIAPSSDFIGVVPEMEGHSFYPEQIDVIKAYSVHYCSDCGAIVYRHDLHDQWHEKVESNGR